jgi:transcriptional regulator with XRE-family HTH domain
MARKIRAYTAIGRRIASVGKRQVAIAKALKISQQTVSKKLRGETAILLRDLEKLAKYYKVPMTFFFEPEDMNPAVSNALDAICNKPGSHHELAKAIVKLSAKSAQKLLAKVG